MDKMKAEMPVVPARSVRRSRMIVLLFFLLIIGIGMAGIVSGYLMRDSLHRRAGQVRIEIRNESDISLKADLFMGEQIGWIEEMDPHEVGFIRFNPKEHGPVLLRLYHKDELLNTLEEGDFAPDTPAHVRFTIYSPTKVRIEDVADIPELNQTTDDDNAHK